MSSKLIDMGIAQCFRCYSIPDHQLSLETGKDKDIFIGRNAQAKLRIPNGETIEVRDVVVLGEMTIESTDLENVAVKGCLKARNVIIPGHTFFRNVAIESQYIYQPRNCQEFKNELHDVLTDWISIQRESANKMNLVSALR